VTRPYDLGDDLDRFRLGDAWSPGRAVFAGHDRPKNWKVDSAKGKTGAATTLNGDDPRKFTATVSLANDEAIEGESGPSEFDLWADFQRLVEAMTPTGGKPFALPIFHPDLARVGITEVTNAGVSGAKYDGKGGASYVITFIEYKPPKPKASSKATAKAGASTGPDQKPDPNAAAKAELAGLLAEAKKAP
jgi:hypothetical protein